MMNNIIKFIPVDPDHLPNEKVLSINKDNEILIGYLFYSDENNDVDCYDGANDYVLDNVTAYIPISQLVELYKQGN